MRRRDDPRPTSGVRFFRGRAAAARAAAASLIPLCAIAFAALDGATVFAAGKAIESVIAAR